MPVGTTNNEPDLPLYNRVSAFSTPGNRIEFVFSHENDEGFVRFVKEGGKQVVDEVHVVLDESIALIMLAEVAADAAIRVHNVTESRKYRAENRGKNRD